VTVEEAKASVGSWLKPELDRALEVLDASLVAAREYPNGPAELLECLGIEDLEMTRARLTSERGNLGEAWCCNNIWNIGIREGTVDDQSRQNDKNYSTHEQYHTFGERVDGRLLLSEELMLAEEKDSYVYSSMYYSGGEEKEDKSIATEGENKGWGERNIYYMRCADTRNELFADKLWHVLTWPMELVESGMNTLRAKYRQSIRENSAGPTSKKVNGRWKPASVSGVDAVKYLRNAGAESLKGHKVSDKLTVTTGSTWHKIMLNKKHMEALEDAIRWRKGIIQLNVGGELTEERFDQTFQGLPKQYVLDTYGKRQ